jgi:hypothetical protein
MSVTPIEWAPVALKQYPKSVRGSESDELVDCSRHALDIYGDAADDPDTGFSCFAYLWRRFGPPTEKGDGVKDLGASWVLTTPESDVWVHCYPKAEGVWSCFGYLTTKAVQQESEKPERRWHEARDNALLMRHPEWFTKDSEGALAITPQGAAEYWRIVFRSNLTPADVEDLRVAEEAAGPFPRRQRRWQDCTPTRQRVNRAVAATLTDLLKPVWSRDIAFNVLGVEGRVPRSTGRLRGLHAHSEEEQSSDR